MRPNIRRKKVSEEITEHITAKINSGHYKPGDKLPSERDLMAVFGCGRSAVREALFALQKDGFVRIRTGERSTISEPTPAFLVEGMRAAVSRLLKSDQGMRDFQETRLIFESALARRAATKATRDEVERIRAALDANRNAPDLPTFQSTDVTFHLSIAEVGGNRNFVALNDALLEWLVEQRRTTGQAAQARDLAIRCHTDIFDAIAGRDPIAAMLAMERHLEIVNELYWRIRTAEEDLHRRHQRNIRRAIRSFAVSNQSGG
jgi:GntR family transcriptional regulator, sialic acid-inducible nan operon repressor